MSSFFKRIFGNRELNSTEKWIVSSTEKFEAIGRNIADDCFKNGLLNGEIVRLSEIEALIDEHHAYNKAVVKNGFLERMLSFVKTEEVMHVSEASGDVVFAHSNFARELLGNSADNRASPTKPPNQSTTAESPLTRAFDLYLKAESEELGRRFFGILISKSDDGRIHVKYEGKGNLLAAMRDLAANANDILFPGSKALCDMDGGRRMVESCIATAIAAAADAQWRRPSEAELEKLASHAVALVTKNLGDTLKELRGG